MNTFLNEGEVTLNFPRRELDPGYVPEVLSFTILNLNDYASYMLCDPTPDFSA